jgi:hypothetical protein
MAAHTLGKFILAEKDLFCRFTLQQSGLFLIVGADDRFDAGIERAGGLDHLPHVEGVGRGHHQRVANSCSKVAVAIGDRIASEP